MKNKLREVLFSLAAIVRLHEGNRDPKINALLDRAAALSAEPDSDGWMPIESAPRETPVLVHNPAWIGAPMICELQTGWSDWLVSGYGDDVIPQPTHWRPLPAPPAARSAAQEK